MDYPTPVVTTDNIDDLGTPVGSMDRLLQVPETREIAAELLECSPKDVNLVVLVPAIDGAPAHLQRIDDSYRPDLFAMQYLGQARGENPRVPISLYALPAQFTIAAADLVTA